jgi:hypothetical protein
MQGGPDKVGVVGFVSERCLDAHRDSGSSMARNVASQSLPSRETRRDAALSGCANALTSASPNRSWGDGQAESRQFGRIAMAPSGGSEAIADLGAPTDIERIIVESAEADDLLVFPVEHGPWAEPQFATLALVTGDMTAAFPQTSEAVRISHGLGVAEKPQIGGIGQTRPAQHQSIGFEPHG